MSMKVLTDTELTADARVSQVYLDNAATSHPKPPQVVEAVRACLAHSLTVARSTHYASFRGDEVLKRCREKLAGFFGASGVVASIVGEDLFSRGIQGSGTCAIAGAAGENKQPDRRRWQHRLKKFRRSFRIPLSGWRASTRSFAE